MKHFLSLGAGVQSSTLALMAAKGEVGPMPDAAIFADTQAEPESVYRWLDWLEKQLPFPVYRVTAGNLTEIQLRLRVSKKTGQTYIRTLIPAYVEKTNGGKSLMGRKCTADFKVRVILAKARKLAAIKRGQKTVGVTSWIGISLDEAHRMKPSREPWAQNIWPLIDINMTRRDCLAWMDKHGYPEPPRSACIYCPFHSDTEWKRLRDNEPDEFAKAVVFDRNLRLAARKQTGTAAFQGDVFLHSSMKPLDQVQLGVIPDKLQMSLFGNECEGLCGV